MKTTTLNFKIVYINDIEMYKVIIDDDTIDKNYDLYLNTLPGDRSNLIFMDRLGFINRDFKFDRHIEIQGIAIYNEKLIIQAYDPEDKEYWRMAKFDLDTQILKLNNIYD